MHALPSPPAVAVRRPPRTPRPAPVPRCASPRVRELARTLPGGTEEFWAAVRREGTPLVETDPRGDPRYAAVTFLWRGTADQEVHVLPNKVADPGDLAGNLMERLPGTDVWHWTLRMRRDWRATYAFRVAGEDLPDPLNPRTLPRRWGGPELSVVELPEAVGLAVRRDVSARGSVTPYEVAGRRVWAYEPPGVLADGLPVAVLFDGDHWAGPMGVGALLDGLVADGRIPPTLVLLPDAVDVGTRWAELACGEAFADFLEEELLPWAAGRWPVTADPARTVLAGQSLGGLMAAYAAVRAPHRFGNVLSQSGSFWWPGGEEGEWLSDVLALAGASGPLPVRFRLSVGEQEWALGAPTRRFRDVLRARGCEVTLREVNGGHDALWWRTELGAGLVALLGSQGC
ncbi:alpha/beta hydrolase-fold protein [Streptomyces sp. NPDC048172]|uniref:alpha/beta hydrolase-fold protein n=1 Tax=Streptomyces sp. NPDC048172 TaxID=3365505 RepID=UPI00371F62BE